MDSNGRRRIVADIYLRGRIYWAKGQDRHGKWWRKSTKQRDPRAAKTVAIKLEQEFALDADQPRDETTLSVAIDTLIDHSERFKRSESTVEFQTTKGRHLVRLLGASTRCSSITPADTTKYAHDRVAEGAHPHTAFHELRTLVQALRRAHKMGLYKPLVEPTHLMPDELRGSYVPRERWLNEREYRLVLDEFEPNRPGRPPGEDRREYIVTMALTGVRLSELHSIEARHIDFDQALLNLEGTKTKGSRRTIPLTPVVFGVLERRAQVRPRGALFPAWHKVQRDLDLACLRIEAKLNPGWKRLEGKKAHGLLAPELGVPARRNTKGAPIPKKDRVRPPVRFDTITPNDLRRTFASWLAQSGVPLFHAAKLMGHGTTKMLERVYARLAPENARSAIALLPESVAGKPGTKPTTRKGRLRREK
jgi:integrase